MVAEQGPWGSAAGAGVSAAQSAGERLLWPGIHGWQLHLLAGPGQAHEQTGGGFCYNVLEAIGLLGSCLKTGQHSIFVIIRKIKKLMHVCWIPQIDDFIFIMERYFHY